MFPINYPIQISIYLELIHQDDTPFHQKYQLLLGQSPIFQLLVILPLEELFFEIFFFLNLINYLMINFQRVIYFLPQEEVQEFQKVNESYWLISSFNVCLIGHKQFKFSSSPPSFEDPFQSLLAYKAQLLLQIMVKEAPKVQLVIQQDFPQYSQLDRHVFQVMDPEFFPFL